MSAADFAIDDPRSPPARTLPTGANFVTTALRRISRYFFVLREKLSVNTHTFWAKYPYILRGILSIEVKIPLEMEGYLGPLRNRNTPQSIGVYDKHTP